MEPTQPRRFLVADDHTLMREGIAMLIQSHWQDSVCEFARDYKETMDALSTKVGAMKFDAVILDLRMPGVSGPSAIGAVVKAAAPSNVVVCTGVEDPGLTEKLIPYGVFRVIHKHWDTEQLLWALEDIFDRPKTAGVDSSAKSPKFHGAHESSRLTGRQLDMLRLLHQGMSNKLIARELGIGVGTVKAHLYVLYKELNVASRSELIAMSRDWFI